MTAPPPLLGGAPHFAATPIMPNVHIGNVAEFTLTALPSGLDDDLANDHSVGCDHYASLAPFYSHDPGVVVMPGARQDELEHWAGIQRRRLGWSGFEPVAWSGDSTMLSSSLTGSPEVMSAVRSGETVVAWGETAGFRSFVERSGARARLCTNPVIAHRADSKLHQIELFAASYRDQDRPAGIELATQRVVNNDDELIAVLVGFGRAGQQVIVKAPRGVGGDGSLLVQPHQSATVRRCTQTINLARERDPFLQTAPLIVQRYCWKRSQRGDLTADFEIDDGGCVHRRGSAIMLIEGGHYVGAVTLDRSSPIVTLAERFGSAVGERLASGGYRGWFDVDYLQTPAGRLVPLEVNARRTGPTVAISIQTAIARSRGSSPSVAVHDALALPARMDATEASNWLLRAADSLGLIEDVVPTLTVATAAATPFVGAAVTGAGTDDAFRRINALSDKLLI